TVVSTLTLPSAGSGRDRSTVIRPSEVESASSTFRSVSARLATAGRRLAATSRMTLSPSRSTSVYVSSWRSETPSSTRPLTVQCDTLGGSHGLVQLRVRPIRAPHHSGRGDLLALGARRVVQRQIHRDIAVGDVFALFVGGFLLQPLGRRIGQLLGGLLLADAVGEGRAGAVAGLKQLHAHALDRRLDGLWARRISRARGRAEESEAAHQRADRAPAGAHGSGA